MRVGPALDRDELLHTHRDARPNAEILAARHRRVDLGRILPGPVDIEEAERVELLVEPLDSREEAVEQVDGLQLARANGVGQLPGVAFP